MNCSHQAPLSMGFPRQEYWSGLLFPSPGDISDPGIEPLPPALPSGFFTTEPSGKPRKKILSCLIKNGVSCNVSFCLFLNKLEFLEERKKKGYPKE